MTTPELPGAGSQQSSPHHSQQSLLEPPSNELPAKDSKSAKSKKPLNVVGLIALIAGAIGFIFACIPGALILGWILLPISFILALVSLFLKGRAKWMGVTALIVSIVGTIVGVVVFLSVVSTSFDKAFGSGETTVVQPSNAGGDSAAKNDVPANAGTRENPSPIGSVIESNDWRVVINSVTLAATDSVLAANQFNKAPAAGSEYILVNYSATYLGDDADGQMPAFVTIEYVTPSGTTTNQLESMAVAPDSFDSMSTLYKDATATGNKVLEVPSASAGDGVLAVRAGMLGDKVFVAVK